MTTAGEALATLRRAVPDIGTPMALLVLTIGRLESHWGDGWRSTPGVSSAAAGSHNWGAIHAGSSWRGATFTAPEKRWQRDQVVDYTGTFRAYPSAEEGARDLWHLLASRYTAATDAALNGQWERVSEALYDQGYYTGTAPREQAIAAHRRRFMPLLEQTRADIGAGPVAAAGGLGGVGILFLLWALSGRLRL